LQIEPSFCEGLRSWTSALMRGLATRLIFAATRFTRLRPGRIRHETGCGRQSHGGRKKGGDNGRRSDQLAKHRQTNSTIWTNHQAKPRRRLRRARQALPIWQALPLRNVLIRPVKDWAGSLTAMVLMRREMMLRSTIHGCGVSSAQPLLRQTERDRVS
jgi:hypothetical protein